MAIREKLRPSDERSGNLCVGLITCFFCVTVLIGTAFFVLYLVLPVSASTSWFPIAGIVLISLPWVFWMLTCTYRVVAHGRGIGTYDQAPIQPAKVAPASGTATDDVADEGDVESPGGARRVRFGGATVMASDERRGSNGANDGQVDADKGTSNEEGSSPASHESETPLALSMT